MTEALRGDNPAIVATTHYERLRGDVLAANRTSGLGLLVLMRNGVAAWLAQAPTPSTTVTVRASTPCEGGRGPRKVADNGGRVGYAAGRQRWGRSSSMLEAGWVWTRSRTSAR